MTTLAEDTLVLRQTARLASRRARLALPAAYRRQAAGLAARHALRLIHRLGVRRLAIYLAAGSELDTAPLLRQLPRHLTVHVPVTTRGGGLRFVRLHPGTRLRRAAYGIPTPVRRRPTVAPRDLDLVLLPLLAWDGQGHRLGAGAGYYDRALASVAHRARPRRIGYAFAAQRVPWLPAAPWDVALHGIISERGLHRPRPATDEPT